jgi:two-component system sensor histidine kinase KdpD
MIGTMVDGADGAGVAGMARLWRSLGRWLAATALSALLTALLLGSRANASTAAIVYLVQVVIFAALAGQVSSTYLAVVSAVLFDYYFTDPRHSLIMYNLQDWVSVVAYAGSCLVVGRVAERARRQTRDADRRREEVERLNALSQEMMLHDDAAGLVQQIPRLVEKNFALDAVLLYVREDDRLYSSLPGGGSNDENPGTPALRSEGEDESMLREEASGDAPGSRNRLRDLLRDNSQPWELQAELPGGFTPIHLVFGMKSVGILAWKPDTLHRQVATSIAAQVAIAITRAHAIESSSRLEAARTADRLRAALIDSLTHELRTPLTAIRAAATTLVDGEGLDAETRAELAAIVDEESLRLDSLIGEAMEIAEIESDGIRFQPEPVHLATFLEQVVQESQEELAAHRVSIDAGPPGGPVWIDKHLMSRVFRHLLENAGRYTPAGSRIVLRGRRDGAVLELAVEDNGPGIDAHDLPLIFEKFYRGRQRNSTAKGSGMGLAITRALVSAHGGTIEAESTAGKGTRFRIAIPLTLKGAASGE